MVAKFEAHTAGTDAANLADDKPVKPEGVPDKFWNAEKGTVDYTSWSKSTAEAERKITELSTSQKSAAEQAEAKAKAEAQVKAEADTKAAAEKKTQLEQALATVKAKADAKPEEIQAAQKALDEHVAATKPPEQKAPTVVPVKQLMTELGESFSKNGGKLSDEDYAKAEKSGFDRDTVDAYIAGQVARSEARDKAVLEGAKVTKEQFAAIGEWAGANLPAEEIKSVNEALAKGTPEAAALALAGLKTKFEAAVGQDPKLLGGKPPSNVGDGFKSLAEQKAAQRDKRYGKDEAYTRDVERKIATSTGY
jgi:hypothetical protein